MHFRPVAELAALRARMESLEVGRAPASCPSAPLSSTRPYLRAGSPSAPARGGRRRRRAGGRRDRLRRRHAALCSTVIRYRSRGALRDVGKALRLSEDIIKGLSSQVWSYSSQGVETRHVEALTSTSAIAA